MESLVLLKEKMQKVYAQYSVYIDKGAKGILAFALFFGISQQIGFMKSMANPAVSFVLAIISAFLPTTIIMLIAAVLICIHAYKVSIGMLAIVALVFFVMYVFYVRMSPKTGIALLLMPIAFICKMPSAVAVAFALIGTPVYAIPVAMGTIAYSLINVIKNVGSKGQSGDIISNITGFAKTALTNKDMWISAIAGIACVFVVYGIRKLDHAYAWKIASVIGAFVYMVLTVVGSSIFGGKISVGSSFVGVIGAIVVGLIIEFVFYAVDYSKCESLQYEDDRYYYYVKAVPKIKVGIDLSEKNEVVKEKKQAKKEARKEAKKESKKEPKKESKKKLTSENTEHLLLTQSLEKDLNLKQ